MRRGTQARGLTQTEWSPIGDLPPVLKVRTRTLQDTRIPFQADGGDRLLLRVHRLRVSVGVRDAEGVRDEKAMEARRRRRTWSEME